MAHSGKAARQRLARTANDGNGFGFLAAGIHFLTHSMPIKKIHMHMRIDHAGGHLIAGKINDLGVFGAGHLGADGLNSAATHQNTLVFFPFGGHTVIQAATAQKLVLLFHFLVLSKKGSPKADFYKSQRRPHCVGIALFGSFRAGRCLRRFRISLHTIEGKLFRWSFAQQMLHKVIQLAPHKI